MTPARPGARGEEVLAWLGALGGPATAAELRAATGAGPAVLRTLVSRGPAREFRPGLGAGGAGPDRSPRRPFRLTAEQAAAAFGDRPAILDRRYYPALLQGVTGSGKTEVYLRAIAEALGAAGAPSGSSRRSR